MTKEEVYKLASINNPIINDNGNRIEFENGDCYAKDSISKLYHKVKPSSGHNNDIIERKVGEVFKYDDGTLLKVIEVKSPYIGGGTCSKECYFYNNVVCSVMCSHRNRNITGQCQYGIRNDKKGIYFKKVVSSKNIKHSTNIFILKLLLKEYNRVYKEIKLTKKTIENYLKDSCGDIESINALKNVYFISLKRKRKEINELAAAIKIQKDNVKKSNYKYCI